jgi:hypothetical protein
MSTDQLEGWVRLGTVTTGNGMLAIVPPYYAATLGEHWNERLERVPMYRVPDDQAEGVTLHQVTFARKEGGALRDYADAETAMLINTPGNGGFDVLGRYRDLYGDGYLSLVEVRIVFEDEWDEDFDAEGTDRAPDTA